MSLEILDAIDKASRWMQYDGVEGVGQGQKDGQRFLFHALRLNLPAKFRTHFRAFQWFSMNPGFFPLSNLPGFRAPWWRKTVAPRPAAGGLKLD